MIEQGQVRERVLTDARILEVLGEIDVANIKGFVDVLQPAAFSDERLIVSFADASYIDSSTINALLRFAPEGKTGTEKIVLVAPQGQMCRRVFRLTGLEGVFRIYETVDEAIEGRPVA